MAKKRGRKKKFKLKLNVRTETWRSTLAILLVLASGVILVSLFASGPSANSVIQENLRKFLGLSHVFLIPILLITGLILINTIKWKFVELRILVGLSLMMISTSGLMHLRYINQNAEEAAQKGLGGGIVGYNILTTLGDILSISGGVLVLLASFVIGVIFVSDKSIDEFVEIAVKTAEKVGINRLDFLKNRAKTNSEDPEIEISGNLNLDASNEPIEEEIKEPTQKEIEAETKYEIVPSPAEPQTTAVPEASGTEGSLGTISPTLPYTDKVWELPPMDLLQDPPDLPVDRGDVKQRAKIIEETLGSFGITARVKNFRFGPSVTQYALEADAGTKIAKIANLQYDLALALASPTGSVRIEAPIPGKSLIGIEVPNNTRVPVYMKDLIASEQMKSLKSKLGIILGKDVGGQPITYRIDKMPHLLIAGATGSGKSVFIHSLMASILFRASPQEVKFLLIDPKRVELIHYNDIPHLLTPVITDIDNAPSAFKWTVQEMMRRYDLLETAKVRNIEAYNEKSGFQAMPYIVLIVDELAEIMVTDPAAVEKSIVRIAQLARAVGIHLVLALQRPSTNVVTGLIKANIPCRIAFAVTSQVDSRVIIDQPGAEKLLGKGDMLFVPPDDSKPRRLQGALLTDQEINGLVSYLKAQGTPDYREDMFDMPDTEKSIAAGGENTDELFDDAVEIVIAEQKGSASLLQRRLSIGYSRAARILDELEAKSIVGPPKGSKPRDVLIKGSYSTSGGITTSTNTDLSETLNGTQELKGQIDEESTQGLIT